MSGLLSLSAELLIAVFHSLAGYLTGHFEATSTENEDKSTSQICDDFKHHDPEDTISQEFDYPQNCTDRDSWKRNRPSMKVSLKKSACFSAWVTVFGGVIGIFALFLMYYIISIVYACEWIKLKDPSFPEKLRRRRIIGESYQAFFLYFWQPALLLMVFKWPLLKGVNLMTVTLAGASIDLAYRFFLAVYDLYYPPWTPYPLNFLYLAIVLISSISVSRNILKTNPFGARFLAIKLSVQFLAGAPVLYISGYILCPWIAHQEGFTKVAVLVLALVIAILPKVVSKQFAGRLNGVNHPGTSYVLVSTASTGFSIVYRFIQAEFQSLLAFISISIGHGLIRLFFELITILKERYSAKIHNQNILYSESRGPSNAAYMRTSRSQRLAADMAIHEMISNEAAIVLSVGIIQIYGFVHLNLGIEKYEEMFVELVSRIVSALAIEFLFNILSVMILTRKMNVPVLRVWNLKWKSHLMVCIIVVIMIVTYSTDKVLVIIRARYVAEGKLTTEEWIKTLNNNN